MNVAAFCVAFEHLFPGSEKNATTPVLEQAFTRSFFDPCFQVPGMTSVKNQFLLKVAYGLLPEDECYFEVGTFQGKTLISALLGNPRRKTYACDNFSEFTNDPGLSRQILEEHLQLYRLHERVTFFDSDFRGIVTRERIPEPVGVYFYDGGHTAEDHRDAIVLAEHLLADEALVIIDDWNAPEVRTGTGQGVAESVNHWEQMLELPARHNEDLGQWWNGVAVYSFNRAS